MYTVRLYSKMRQVQALIVGENFAQTLYHKQLAKAAKQLCIPDRFLIGARSGCLAALCWTWAHHFNA